MTTKYTALGTMLGRAIGLPFQKQKQFIVGDSAVEVRDSAAELVDAFSRDDAPDDWSRAELLYDAGGPYMSGPRNDFFTLSARDRAWVLERVVTGATGAGAWLAEHGMELGAEQAWSEVVVTPWTKEPLPETKAPRSPTARRADFLFIGPRMHIFEFKTSCGSDRHVESLYTSALAQAGWYRDAVPKEWWPGRDRKRRAVVFRLDADDPSFFDIYDRTHRA